MRYVFDNGIAKSDLVREMPDSHGRHDIQILKQPDYASMFALDGDVAMQPIVPDVQVYRFEYLSPTGIAHYVTAGTPQRARLGVRRIATIEGMMQRGFGVALKREMLAELTDAGGDPDTATIRIDPADQATLDVRASMLLAR